MALFGKARKLFLLVATLVVVIPILVVIVKNISHAVGVKRQINAIARESELYQEQITRDSLLLESLKYDEGLEKFARENYFLQRKGEKIYIIEQ